MTSLTLEQEKLVNTRRIAHLATADSNGVPHVVPLCFVYHRGSFYSALDQKPKRSTFFDLKRVRNIQANPHVALVVDYYEEEWSRLWYLLVIGSAELLEECREHQEAIDMLMVKYPQYQEMDIRQNPVIRITPARIVSWGSPPPLLAGEN